jgi:hypothetical protein
MLEQVLEMTSFSCQTCLALGGPIIKYCLKKVRAALFIPSVRTALVRDIYDYVEINHLNALNYILLYFSFTMAPTCFGKTMPSSGRDYVPF